MKLMNQVIDLTVVATFSVMFAGYALFVYPIEKMNEKMSTEVKEKKLKYTPTITEG
ncbi:hypothetical protein [Halobacillus halophilus]|uniref:hypothetical protein n=1 Tax=Halobacillus halophilus TaxID=1570 RepID=UPI001CD29D68|nr:hypothetical protein [Halobacillus halophilus]MCA1009978.1 hypothetical protein [Halobacillus halophilus]